jgi:mono/diheme cytochrome c family protein
MSGTRTVLAAAGLLLLLGCSQGQPHETRPLMLIPDMEFQPKYLPQGYTTFYPDYRTMRVPPAGTVAFGTYHEDTAYYEGKVDGELIVHNPRAVTLDLLERGQARFNIYCAPCHDRTGSGKGMVVGYGLVPPPTFHQDRIRDVTDGYLFDVITHGVRNMPAYGAQVPVGDRWAIVAYLRALQLSQNATLADVPQSEREGLR